MIRYLYGDRLLSDAELRTALRHLTMMMAIAATCCGLFGTAAAVAFQTWGVSITGGIAVAGVIGSAWATQALFRGAIVHVVDHIADHGMCASD